MKFKFEGPKKILTTLGIVAAATPSIAQGPNTNQKADQAFANTGKNKIEYSTNTANKIADNAKKVKEVPPGYVKDRTEGNKTYYKKITTGNKEVPIAKAGAVKGDNIDFLITQLQSGVSPEELVNKGHASSEGIKKFKEYYKPSSTIDVVYIEPENKIEKKEVDPYAAYAITGEGVYLPGESGHNTGQISYTSRLSKNIQESGGTASDKEDFVMRFEDGNGKLILKDSEGNYYPGGFSVKIKAIDKNKYFDISGKHLLPGALEALTKLAKEQWEEFNKQNKEEKKDVQKLGPDYMTKANTVGLPGSNIDQSK